MTRSPVCYSDFSQGYSDLLPADKIPDNMMSDCLNVNWEKGIVKRGGVAAITTTGIPAATTVIRAMARVYINSKWTTVLACDVAGTGIVFYQDNATANTFVEIKLASTASFAYTTGSTIRMDVFGDKVIAVCSTGKPTVIYYSSSIIIANLETYDTRTRGNEEWFAGYYVAATGVYTDDTTDAQSTTADDQTIFAGATGDGFYVAGVTTFNKIVLKAVNTFTSDPTATYQYYKSGAWTAITPTTKPTAAQWGAGGDLTVEFDIPLDWTAYDGSDPTNAIGGMSGRYLFRITFAVTSSAVTCDYTSVYHTQYLTQIIGGSYPTRVVVHNSRVYLAYGNTVNYSPYNAITGWRSNQVEYFVEGGQTISAMKTCGEYLAVVKGAAIYGLFGKTTEDLTIRKLINIGTPYGDTVVSIGGVLWFLAEDGFRVFTGSSSVIISKHIDLSGVAAKKSYAHSCEYMGDYFCTFETAASYSYAFRFDPDSFETTKDGNGQVAFFKYSNWKYETLIWCKGDSDTRYFLGTLGPALYQMENANAFDGTATAIDALIKTKPFSFKAPEVKKTIHRIKTRTTNSGVSTVTIDTDKGRLSTAITIASAPSATGEFQSENTVPYGNDGNFFAVQIENNTVNAFKVYDLAFDFGRRNY